MVDELVLLRQHHVAVESEEPPELLRIENVDTLELAVPAVELVVYLYRELDVRRMAFGEP